MLVRRQPARSLMVRVCAAVLVLLPLLAAFTTATAARDIGDGSLTIVAWQCRQGVDADAQLPAGFEAECTTRADLVTFVLTDPAGSPELEARRQTGYPKRND